MTCAHVLGLIDAWPFADYPRAHLDAAWQHARGCATCGPALAAASVLTSDLIALPQITAPPDLAAVVLARIAQIEPAETIAVTTVTPRPFLAPEWPSWATTLGGLAAAFAVVLTILADNPMVSALLAASGSTIQPVPSLPTAVLAFLLLAGLVLYLTGLFAPFAARRHR